MRLLAAMTHVLKLYKKKIKLTCCLISHLFVDSQVKHKFRSWKR